MKKRLENLKINLEKTNSLTNIKFHQNFTDSNPVFLDFSLKEPVYNHQLNKLFYKISKTINSLYKTEITLLKKDVYERENNYQIRVKLPEPKKQTLLNIIDDLNHYLNIINYER